MHINNQVRKKLGITALEYIVCDFIGKHLKDGLPSGKYKVFEEIGVNSSQASSSVKRLAARGLIQVGDKTTATKDWYTAHIPETRINPSPKTKSKVRELCNEAIEYYNKQTGSNARTSKVNVDLVSEILKKDSSVVADHFKMVIDFKIEEWQNDEMAKYIRPTTLFGGKFLLYLEQAKEYFRNKKKK